MTFADLYRRVRNSPTAVYALLWIIGTLVLLALPVIYATPASSSSPYAVFIHFFRRLADPTGWKYILWPYYWFSYSGFSAVPWALCAVVVYLLMRFRIVSWRGGCSAVLVSWIWDVSFKSYFINLNVIAKDGLGMGLTFLYSPFMVLGIIVLMLLGERGAADRARLRELNRNKDVQP